MEALPASPPLIAACVTSEAEAATCRAAGLAVVRWDGSKEAFAAAGGEGAQMMIEGLGALPVWVDARPGPGELDRVASAGQPGVLLLGRAAPVLRAQGPAALAALADQAGARGLRLAVAGALEPPDVPRLIALGASVLVIGRAVRVESRADGRLDPTRIALMRDLLQARQVSGAVVPAGPDRIFVRDYGITMGVGAYGWEREAPQRVRFTVEADLVPGSHEVRGMADVVSYDLITDAIEALAGREHVELVETLAEAVAVAVLAHPRVARVNIRVEKLDLGPHVVGVEITRARAAGA